MSGSLSSKLKFVKRFRDPLYGYIDVTKNELQILDHPLMQRLRNINQLALTKYVYPTAEHSRFSHSLGVLACVTKMFDNLFSNEKKKKAEDVTGWDHTTTLLNLKTLRFAALLHDIGHLPFSHATEAAFLRVTPEYSTSQNSEHLKHENVSQYLIQKCAFIHEQIEKDNILSSRVASLLSGEVTPQDYLLKRFISGDLDADRADYLRRDSYACGVQYGEFDFERYVRAFSVEQISPYSAGLAIKEADVPVIEAFLLARYHYYRQIPYHRTRRGYDILLEQYLSASKRCEEYKNIFQFAQGHSGKHEISNIDVDRFAFFDDGQLMESIKRDATEGDINAKYLLRRGHLHPLFVGDNNRDDTEKEWENCIQALKNKLDENTFFSKQLLIKPPELLADPAIKEEEEEQVGVNSIPQSTLDKTTTSGTVVSYEVKKRPLVDPVMVHLETGKTVPLAACSKVLKSLKEPVRLFFLFVTPEHKNAAIQLLKKQNCQFREGAQC